MDGALKRIAINTDVEEILIIAFMNTNEVSFF